MRIARLLPAAFLATGCYDFQGELGQLGFSSNLITRSGQSWSPEQPISADTPVEVGATTGLTIESDEPPRVEAAVAGTLVALDPTGGQIAFTGEAGDSGRVLFWGEATDRFSVRFHDPAQVVLFTPDGTRLSQAPLTVIEGAEVRLLPEVHDAWGQPLGWSAEQLEAHGTHTLSAQSVAGTILLTATGPGTLSAELDGLPLLQQPIETIAVSEVEHLSLSVHEMVIEQDTLLVVQAQGQTADGSVVHGLNVQWALSEDVEHWPESTTLFIPMDAAGLSVSAILDGRVWSIDLQDFHPETTSTSSVP